MILIRDLVRMDREIADLGPLPAVNPLADTDALQEAQLLDVYFDVKQGVAALLFELRQALQLDEGSAGILVARGIRALTWRGPERTTHLTAWSVGSSRPRAREGVFELTLAMWPHPGAELSITAASAGFCSSLRSRRTFGTWAMSSFEEGRTGAAGDRCHM